MHKTVLIFLFSIFSNSLFALNIITTTTDLESIAKEIGGDRVNVSSLAQGNDDAHYLQARPDYIRKVNQADMLVLVGLDLEIGWLPLVIKQARNKKVAKGGSGYCDASRGIRVLEKPRGEINRSMGDIHIYGNPHYWVDPLMGLVIAKNIKNTLIRIDSKNANYYRLRFNNFRQKISKLTSKLLRLMKPHKGKKIFVYHREFSYLAKRFGLKITGSIEEKPGVAPSPAHMRRMIRRAKSEKIKVILNTPWSNLSYSRKVAQRSEAKLILLPMQTKSSKGTSTYLKMIEKVVTTLAKHL